MELRIAQTSQNRPQKKLLKSKLSTNIYVTYKFPARLTKTRRNVHYLEMQIGADYSDMFVFTGHYHLTHRGRASKGHGRGNASTSVSNLYLSVRLQSITYQQLFQV